MTDTPQVVVVACMRTADMSERAKAMFSDNAESDCADCGARVTHRPNLPEGTKLCVPCAMAMASNERCVGITCKQTDEQLEEADRVMGAAEHRQAFAAVSAAFYGVRGKNLSRDDIEIEWKDKQ